MTLVVPACKGIGLATVDEHAIGALAFCGGLLFYADGAISSAYPSGALLPNVGRDLPSTGWVAAFYIRNLRAIRHIRSSDAVQGTICSVTKRSELRKLDINITGAGPHDVIPAIPGSRIIVQRLILTISHAKDKAQLVSFLSGSNLIVEFYVLDGGEIEYERREGDSNRIELGDAFNVTLETDVSAAGVVFYEVGGQ